MGPHYVSSRDGSTSVSFREALLRGLAPDGGLFVPEHVPLLDLEVLRRANTFSELSYDLLASWLRDEVEENNLSAIISDALSFPVPLVPLGGSAWDGVYVLELFHGPTLSFKDFGARTMARLMAHFVQERGEELTILVATSGDTGSAVADGFAGQDGIRVVLLYPRGQVSPVQERQLIVRRPGVQALAVEGTFDDCQRLVKTAFQDDHLRELMLSSANSINVGRLLPQMTYYVWGGQRLGFDDVVYCVPSGNLGNLTAGILASLGGLPARRFIAAHNANDFFPRFLAGAPETFGPSVRTLSNAMDVGAPSNFERLRFLMSREQLAARIVGESVSDEATLDSMRRVYDETGYVADPHTAVGLEAVRRYRARTGEHQPVVVLSTAHPAKFPETVRAALGREPEVPRRLSELWERETAVTSLSPEPEALRDYLLAGVA